MLSVFSLLAVKQSRAGNDTWTGGGAPDGNWQDANNWGGTAPVAGDFLFFDTGSQLLATNNYSAGTLFGNLTFNSGAGSFALSGNAMALAAPIQDPSGNIGGGGVTNLSAVAETNAVPVTLSDGFHNIVNAGGGQLNLAGMLVRNTDATVAFNTNGGVINLSGSSLTNDASANGGILGGWSVIDIANNAGDWAALDGSSNVIAYSGYTSFDGGTSFGGTQAGNNVKIQTRSSSANTLNGSMAGTYDMNTLLWNIGNADPAGNQTLNISSGQILRLGVHGGIMNVHGNSRTFIVGSGSSGVLTAGGPGNNTTGELTLVQLTANGGQLQINSTLGDNGAGAVTVNEVGSVNYNFANTYSGGTHLHYGEAYLQGGASFGSGPIYIYPGARADFGGNNGVTVTNNFFVSGMGFVPGNQPGVVKGTYTGTFTGQFTLLGDTWIDPNAGSASCTFAGPFTGTGSLSIGGPVGYYVEGTAIFGGNCSYTGDTIVDATANNNGGAGIRMASGASNIMNNGGNLNLVGGSTGVAVFDLNGTTQTINGLVAVNGNPENTVVESSAAGAVLVVGNHNTSSVCYGNLKNGSGALGLTKIGTGTVALDWLNTYTGPTVVSNGVLSIGNSLASSQILVASQGVLDVSSLGIYNLGSGQTLGGNGAVNGSVSASSGSTISPGFGAGTLTLSNDLTLNTGAVGLFTLSATTNGANGQIAVGGNLNLNGGTIQISGATLQVGRYKLITYSGVENGTVAANLTLSYNGGQSLGLDDSIPGEIDLVVGSAFVTKLTWQGDNSQNVWDINSTADWLNGAIPSVFTNGTAVVFNDSGSKSPDVNISAVVQPLSLLVSNNTGAYTFSGGGSLAGGTGLTKQGSGALVLNDTGGDSFSGGVLVQGGSLAFSNASMNLSGGLIITNSTVTMANYGAMSGDLTVQNAGSILLDQVSGSTFSGNTIISNNAAVQLGGNDSSGVLPSGGITLNGTLNINRTDDITVANTISGTGTLFKTNNNTLTLSAANGTWAGAALITQGTLKIGAANAVGSGGNTPITISRGATLDFNGISGNLLTVIASGAGAGGSGGAIVNNGADVYPVVTNIMLAGDTVIGGTGRWDLRSLGGTAGNPALASLKCAGGQPFNLTKSGGNFIGIVAATVDTNLADIDVQSGTLDIEGNTTGLGNPTNALTVETGATLFFWQPTNQLNKKFVMQDGAWFDNESGATVVVGPVALSTNASGGPGDVNFNCGGSSLAFSNVISGPGNLNKLNGGSYLFLSATNTYTGNTVVDAGWLALVGNGSIATSPNIVLNNNSVDATFRMDSTFTLAGGQTLTGTNSGIQGILVASLGSVITPGGTNNIGILTVSSNATLAGVLVMDVDKTTGTNDLLTAGTNSSLAYGGTLVITNLTASLAAGDSFKLFDAGSYNGAFAAISPAVPGTGLVWDTSSLTNNGVLSVISATKPAPVFTSISLSGTTLTFTATNGAAGQPCVLLTSTNVSLALTNWTPVLTNAFDGNGNLNLSTDIASPGGAQQFYILQQ